MKLSMQEGARRGSGDGRAHGVRTGLTEGRLVPAYPTKEKTSLADTEGQAKSFLHQASALFSKPWTMLSQALQACQDSSFQALNLPRSMSQRAQG